MDRAKVGLGVNPGGISPSRQLQNIETVVSLDESILIGATWKMMSMYGCEVIGGSKDNANCCGLEAALLASST